MSTHTKVAQTAGIIGWLAVSFIASIIGAAASTQPGDFYLQLVRPDWAPQPWVFGPVWTLLYTLMGVSAWLVWRVDGFRLASVALPLFLVQLAFNAAWSWVFFGWHHGALSFLNILILWLLIMITLLSFWRIRPLAGVLLIPYQLWVSFAAVLNYFMWQLNPQLL